MENHPINQSFEFSSFQLDAENFHLTWKGETIPLTPKEFNVLLLLVENAGKVVTKEELLRTVWKDTFVEEATLTRNISWLRKKLSVNGANNIKIIETVPKRGYRFLPKVNESGEKFSPIEEKVSEPLQTQNISEMVPAEVTQQVPLKVEPGVKVSQNDSELSHVPLPDSGKKFKISVLNLFAGLMILAILIFLAYIIKF